MNDTLLAGSILTAGVIIGFWVICFIAAFTLTRWIMSKFDD
jgi:DNA-binding transcriptional regulator of glucitol operon